MSPNRSDSACGTFQVWMLRSFLTPVLLGLLLLSFQLLTAAAANATPDLTPVEFTGDSSGLSGHSVRLSWVVKNQGTGTALPQWYDYIYFSTNNVWDSQDTVLRYRSRDLKLDVGASYTAMDSIQLPQVGAGNYFLILRVDNDNAQIEANEANNSIVFPITITTPDLTPVEFTGDSSGLSGHSVRLSWVVKNQGTGTALPQWYDYIYFSTNNVWDSQDTVLRYRSRDLKLDVGASYTAMDSIQLPQVGAGNYFLILRVDNDNAQIEANEANNSIVFPITITTPDLTPVEFTGDSSGLSGHSVRLSWVVKNQGTGTALPQWYDYIYFSTNNVWDSQDTVLRYRSRDLKLDVGASYTAMDSIQLPQVGAGNYFLILRVDNDNAQIEANEANNSIVFPITITTPDLTPVEFTGDSSGLSGHSVRLSWVVKNQGTGTALPQWYDYIYFSTNNVWDSQDTVLRYRSRDLKLDVGASYTAMDSIQLPQVGAGNYFLILRVDNDNAQIEANEANNSIVFPITITTPDLTPVEFTGDSSGLSGHSVRLSWVVKNQGTGTALPQWYDYIYFSTNNVWDSQDTVLRYRSRDLKLDVGASYTAMDSIQLPQVGAGNYFLILRVDNDNAQIEANEANNSIVFPIAITTPDLTPYDPTAESGNGAVRINWTLLPDATSYNIYFASAPGVTPATGTKIFSVTPPYTHTGLSNGIVYYYVITAVTNNTEGIESFQISAQPNAEGIALVDFTPVTLSAPASGGTGSPVEVTWVVKNQGTNEAATTWYDRIYFSTDTTWDNQDSQLSSYYWTYSLGVGENYTQTQLLNLPQVPTGTYYLILRTDSDEYLYEADEANNVLSQAIALTVPDLTPVTLSAPPSGGTGSPVEVTWVVKNQGTNEAATTWYDRIYFSTDTTWDNQDSQLSSYYWTYSLGVGENYTQTQLLNLPQVPTGTYYLILRTDSDEYLYEADEANNVLSQAIALTVPDLTPVTLSAPPSGGTGSPVEVTWVVKNQGTNEAATTWYDRIYFSTDTTWDNQDSQLSSYYWTYSLGVGENYTQTQLLNLPQVPTGTYYLILRTDSDEYLYEADEANNVLSQAIALTVPDLTPVTLSAPPSGGTGSPVEVTWVVKNQGTNEAATTWYDRIYFSTDTTWDNQDSQLSSYYWTYSLGVGENYTQTQLLNLPQVPTGTYYLILRTDSDEYLYEADEANNVLSQAIALTVPDLTPVTLSAPPSGGTGSPVEVTWVVKNQGTNEAATTWYDRIYFSTDTTWDNQDSQLSSYYWTYSLGVGENYTQTQLLNLPQVPTGTYYLILRTDSDEYLYEADEANNVLSQAIALTAPDLIATALTATSSVVSGQQVDVSWQVKNQGNGPASFLQSGGWYDAIFFSTDNAWDSQDQLLRRVQRDSELSVNASYAQSTTVTIPEVPAGNYYLIAYPDDPNYCGESGCLFESNEANNNLSFSITLTLPDLMPTAIQTLHSWIPGWAASIHWIITNLGSGNALGGPQLGWSDRLYLSQDDVLDSQDRSLAELRSDSTVAPGLSYTRTVSVQVPDISTGAYHLFVQVDSYDELFESDEANNLFRQSIELYLPEQVRTPWRTLDSTEFGNFSLGYIDFSPNGDRVVVAAGSRAIIWSIQSPRPGFQFTGHGSTVDAVDFSPSGGHVLSGARDGTSRIWDAATGQQIRTFAATAGQPNPATFSTDGTKILAGSGLNLPRLWEQATGSELRTFPGHSGTVNAVALSPDGTKALTGSADDTAILWDTATGKKLFTFTGHTGDVLSVAFSPDGMQALTSSNDSTVRLWDTVTGHEIKTFVHGGSQMMPIPHALFSQDGQYVISHDSMWPSTAYLWEISSQTLLRTLSAEESGLSSINGLAISPDQTIVATSHSDGQIRLWSSGLPTVSLQPITSLEVGTSHTITLQSYGLHYYEVDVDAGRNIVISLTSDPHQKVTTQEDVARYANLLDEDTEAVGLSNETESVRIVVSKDRLPTVYQHDFSSQTSSTYLQAEIPIGATFANSKYYILVYSPYLASGSLNAVLHAQYSDLHLSSMTPSKAGNEGKSTVAIRGTGLGDNAEVFLVSPTGVRIPAETIRFNSETLLYATFDLKNTSSGLYDLHVRRLNDQKEKTLEDELEIVAGAQGRLQLSIEGPEVIRPGRTYQYQVPYRNTGDADLPAPFVSVSTASQGTVLATAGYTSTNQLIWLAPGNDSPGNVLPPEQEDTLGFTAMFQEGTELVVGVVEENDQAFDWSIFEQHLRPTGVADTEWRPFWERVTSQIGQTNSEVFATLRQLNSERSRAVDLTSLVKYAVYIAAQSDASTTDLGDLLAASVSQVEKYDPTQDVKVASPPGTTFHPDRPTIVVTHGWKGTTSGDRFEQLAMKLAEKYPTHNVVQVTWDKGSKAVLPWNASKNIPAAAEQAVSLLSEKGYSKWNQTIYVGESFGNGINAEMSRIAPAKGKALILNAANPMGYPSQKVPDYKNAFSDSISIQTWDVADDGNVGNRGILYRKPKEEHCGGRECNMTGDSHSSGVRLLRRLLDINPNLAQRFLNADWRGLQIEDRGDGLFDAGIDSDGQFYLGDIIPQPVYTIGGLDVAPQANKQVNPVRAIDPNDKIGPAGMSVRQLVASNTRLNYTVNFENMRTATAPVQELVIIDYLDSDLDWTSFRFEQLGYSDHQLSLPDSALSFEMRDIPPAQVVTGTTEGLMAIDISASADPQTGKVEWRLITIDTGTEMFPEDALAGFLPPEDGTGRGMGFITYSIQPKTTLSAGTQITNKASIVFDTNDPIETNTVTNTIGVAADLALTISNLDTDVQVGETFVFTAFIYNDGPDLASGVVFTSSIPSEATLLSANSSQGNCSLSTNSAICGIGSLPNNTTVAVTVKAVANSERDLQITSGIKSADTVMDVNSINNKATRRISVTSSSRYRVLLPIIHR